MSVQPSLERCPTRQLPTIPAPMITHLAFVGNSLILFLCLRPVIYHQRITAPSLSARAYAEIRSRIVRLELAPGDVLREESLQDQLGIGRTPIREALQRMARDQFVSVIPRRGMLVTPIDVSELGLLFETRAVMEPYAGRLACMRGTPADWDEMRDALHESADAPGDAALLDVDRRCHEITWRAAGNRFLTDT